MALWVSLAKRAGVTKRGHTRHSAEGRALHARLQEHGPEAVAQVMRWYWLSDHKRATFLRESGELMTPMRPSHFGGYLDWAREMPPEAPPATVATRHSAPVDPWAERRALRLRKEAK